MQEITFYGRGGQGAVTAAQILATAAFKHGLWSQTFPQFGGERRGAPVMAYVRLDREAITIRSKVYAPDVSIVLDFNLFKMLDPLADLKPKGTAILNTPQDAGDLPPEIRQKAGQLYIVEATRIAQQIYGPTTIPITNVVILGAYCAAMGDVPLQTVLAALPEFFPQDKVPKNVEAAEAGYNDLRRLS